MNTADTGGGVSDKLIKLDETERALAQIQTLDEAKGIRDKAEALRIYAKSAKKGLGIQNRAARIKILAEQRAGKILAEVPRNTPKGKKEGKGLRTTLVDNGIAPMTAHRWQKMSLIPPEKIAELEAKATGQGEELTSSLTADGGRYFWKNRMSYPYDRTNHH